jgi:hypothetical protein
VAGGRGGAVGAGKAREEPHSLTAIGPPARSGKFPAFSGDAHSYVKRKRKGKFVKGKNASDFAPVPAGISAKPNENTFSPLYFAVDNQIGLPTRFVIEPEKSSLFLPAQNVVEPCISLFPFSVINDIDSSIEKI